MTQAHTNENDCFVDGPSVVRSGPKVTVSSRRAPTTPCPKCGGCGGRWWPDTSTWRKSVGGRAITRGVCDLCWGSGDITRPWTDLRALQAEEDRRVAEQAWSYFAEGLGTDLPSIAASLIELAKEISKIRCPSPSKRKARPQFFENVCAHLERVILEGITAWERAPWPPAPLPQPNPDKAKQLWAVCMAWRDKVDPTCEESVVQSDRVNLSLPELAIGVMEVLGYANRCQSCGEKCADLVCDVCSGRSES